MDHSIGNPALNDGQKSADRLTVVLSTAVDGVIIIDDGGLIEVFNPACERLFGYAADDVMGKNVNILMPAPYHDEHDRYLHVYLVTGERKIIGIGREVSGRRKDGSVFPMELSVGEASHGGKRFFVGIIRDVTERHLQEREIRNAKEAAEAASAAKTQFLAVMSHELRTPLNAIIGFSEVLTQGIGGSLTDTQKDYLNDIRQAGQQLLSLVNDLLDLSKIEAGRYDLSLERLAVGSVVADATGMLASLAREREIDLDSAGIDGGLQVIADPRALRQMLQNLLSNALKFTPPGGHIDVSAIGRADTVEIVVADTGIGIAPEDLAQVTEPFHQVDNVLSRKHDGTGLGLAIVKGLMVEHGGRLEIASEPGRGTKVTLAFPLPTRMPRR
ncbi:MAG: ATP-binding protein [Rhodospirillaceae bacterium]